MTKLTAKQQDVLGYVQRYIAEHGLPPLIREIQSGCNILSYKSTVDRLNSLERKGFIRRRPNKHRGIRVVYHRQAAQTSSAPATEAGTTANAVVAEVSPESIARGTPTLEVGG